MSAVRPSRTRFIDPELAARVPAIRSAAVGALIVGALTAVCVVVQAVALATAIDRSLLHHDPLTSLRPELIVFALAIVARATIGLVGERRAERTAESVVATMRAQLLHQVLALGPTWLGGERPGELSLTATRGLRSLHTYFARYLPQAAMAAVVPVVLLAWIATQDWLSFVIVVALVIAVPDHHDLLRPGGQPAHGAAVAPPRVAGRPLPPAHRGTPHPARLRTRCARAAAKWPSPLKASAPPPCARCASPSSPRSSMDLIAGFGVGFVAMALGLRLLWGELDLQTAMAVLLVTPEIFIPLRRAGAEFHASTEGQAAAARVLEVLALTPDNLGVAPANAIALPAARSLLPAAAAGKSTVDLRVDGLRIAYDNRASATLEAFSLHAPAGSRVALVGPSGAGKSSVIRRLLRFVEPSGGIALGRRNEVVRCPGRRSGGPHFSWLPQRPYLFTATLAENLRLGAPEATDEVLEQVTAAVGLDRLVDHLPLGLATPLGQDGLTLSAGERQRVALARALLRPAPILLLDEPTASLDPPTTKRMAEAIAPWLAGRTVIVAAHEPVAPRPISMPSSTCAPLRLTAVDAMKPIRRIMAEPGTPYGRLALAGLLGLAAAAATIGLLAGSGYVLGRAAFRPRAERPRRNTGGGRNSGVFAGPVALRRAPGRARCRLARLGPLARLALRLPHPTRPGGPLWLAQRGPSHPGRSTTSTRCRTSTCARCFPLVLPPVPPPWASSWSGSSFPWRPRPRHSLCRGLHGADPAGLARRGATMPLPLWAARFPHRWWRPSMARPTSSHLARMRRCSTASRP